MNHLPRQRLEFSYTISDERLIAYSKVPLLERLKWLDEIRQFTLLARAAAHPADLTNKSI